MSFTDSGIIPASFSAALVWQEWIVVGIWLALGVFFYFYSKRKYGAEFGRDIFIVDETKDVDGAPAVLPNAKYPDRHFVITVGCKYGSGGPESARMVADYCILQARNVATDIPVISCLTAVCWAGMQRLSLSRNW